MSDEIQDEGGIDPGLVFDSAAPPVDEGPVKRDEPALLTVPDMKRMLLEASASLKSLEGDRFTYANLALTEFEAGMIAPGLVKYANARPAVRAVFGGNEYLKLATGMILYGARVAGEHAAGDELRELDELANEISEGGPDGNVD